MLKEQHVTVDLTQGQLRKSTLRTLLLEASVDGCSVGSTISTSVHVIGFDSDLVPIYVHAEKGHRSRQSIRACEEKRS